MLPELGKARIALPVSLSAMTGFLAAARGWEPTTWALLAGVFFLALGASALNQVQEYSFDLRMERTKNRPIPSGRISPKAALLTALFFIFLGAGILLYWFGPQSFMLGLLTIFWYNILYTYLKRITAFAVVPGSVVGALPPLIGWSASGLPIENTAALTLAGFFFIGQIPHFWLIILSIGKQYEEAGYPSLSAVLSAKQIGRLTLIWIVTTGIAALFLPLNKTILSPIISWLLVGGVVWLIWTFSAAARKSGGIIPARRGFIRLNLFFLYVMVLIWLDVLIS